MSIPIQVSSMYIKDVLQSEQEASQGRKVQGGVLKN